MRLKKKLATSLFVAILGLGGAVVPASASTVASFTKDGLEKDGYTCVDNGNYYKCTKGDKEMHCPKITGACWFGKRFGDVPTGEFETQPLGF